jgi:hypothetical protein
MRNLAGSLLALWSLSCLLGGALSGCNAQAQAQSLSKNRLPRFEVEVHTQGDTVVKSKAFRSIQLNYYDEHEVTSASFECPPWKGGHGAPLKSAGRSMPWEVPGYRRFWGCGSKIQPGQPATKPSSADFSAGTICTPEERPALNQPAGLYRLVAPGQSELALTEQQNFLDYPRNLSVTGNDTTGYKVSWKAVAGAAGYLVSTSGSKTFWTNTDLNWRDFGVEDALKQGILLRETTCLIPGGMYGEPFQVCVDAISPDVFVPGEITALGYSHAEKTLEVRPSMGAAPRNPDLTVEDPDLDSRPSDPFRAAIFDGDFERVSALAKSNPSLINQRFDAVNPLMMALMRKRRKITKFLIEQGAEVNLTDEANQSPLDFACCFSGDRDMVELLLKHGARIEGNGHGETPLHQATRSGELGLVQVLLQHGANPNSKDGFGLTPLDYAKQYHPAGFAKIAALLKAYGARHSPPRPAPKPRPQPKPHRQFPAPTKEAVFQALEQAESIELHSVDPEDFRFWKGLGRVRLTGSEKAAVVSAVQKGIAESDGLEAACFNPRHAIVVRRPGHGYCLIACYECLQVYANEFDPTENYEPSGHYGKSVKMLTTGAPAELLNEILHRHKVKLPTH